jgi:DNA-binding CsgD family transcriptional regulator/tetratricopeptide (TPR) repeat protein
MKLLERESYLAELESALAQAAAGAGCIALVSGEAGIGKTSLMETFTCRHNHSVPVYQGACDSLFTPRPFGPVHDMALQLHKKLPELLASDSQHAAIFSTVLNALQRQPSILVFEDVHWADEATLDLVRFLGRRIMRIPSLLVITYRDDELNSQHPLRKVLGDLTASPAVRRIVLKPLSENGVRALIGERSMDAAVLHRKTGGNPFYITEILASPANGIPLSIRDAVLARAAQLSPSAEAVLRVAAIIGMRIEPRLLLEVTGEEAHFIEECISAGMLVSQGDVIVFRHELARQIILETISPHRKLVLHRLVLASLNADPDARQDFVRLAHHAEAAGDRAAVLEFAPKAAQQASAAGAHRAAAALYALTLHHADDLPPAERALFHEAYAWESNLIGDQHESVASRRQAIELWRAVANPLKEGENLAHLTLALLSSGQGENAQQYSRAAIQILEKQPPGKELALAYRNQALLESIDHNLGEATVLAEKAVALAEQFGDARVLAMSYDTLGSNLLSIDFERGKEYLQRCLVIARESGLDGRVATVYANLGSTACELYRFEIAGHYLSEGIEYCAERDLDMIHYYLLACQSLVHMYLGRWREAAESAGEVLVHTVASTRNRLPALVALGRLHARQGGSDAHRFLTDALTIGSASGLFENIAPVRAALAESAWLEGDRNRVLSEAHVLYDLAVSRQHPWLAGEAAFWLWQCGELPIQYDWIAAPFALQIAGKWQTAADEWGKLGCPYEQARALADGDDQTQITVLKIFERLGARPAAENLRQRLQKAGITKIPRKPRTSTSENPFGLTERQVEILALLIDDLSNSEISARLHISPKTVDHHVSAILEKMELHSRQDAAASARNHPHFVEK